MTNDKREEMYDAAKEKYGIEFSTMVAEKGCVAFDRYEARPASKDEAEDYVVTLNGKTVGMTKVVGTLDADIIERNIGWLPRIYCGAGAWVDTEGKTIRVDKKTKTVKFTENA